MTLQCSARFSGRSVARNIADHLGVSLYHRKRRSEVVRNVREEVAPHFLGVFGFLDRSVKRDREFVVFGDADGFESDFLARAHSLRGRGEFGNRFRDALREQITDYDGNHRAENRDRNHLVRQKVGRDVVLRDRSRNVKVNFTHGRRLLFARDKRIVARSRAKVIHRLAVFRFGKFPIKLAVAVERRSVYFVAAVAFRSGVGHDDNFGFVRRVAVRIIKYRDFHGRGFNFAVEHRVEFFVGFAAGIPFVVERRGYTVASLQYFLFFHTAVGGFENNDLARPQRNKDNQRHSDEVHPCMKHQTSRFVLFVVHFKALSCTRARAK